MCVDNVANELEDYINGRRIRKKNKVSKVFYSEYMQKKRPKALRFLFGSYKDYLLGILSPSLCSLVWMDEKNLLYMMIL